MKFKIMLILVGVIASMAVGCRPSPEPPTRPEEAQDLGGKPSETEADPKRVALAAKEALFKQLSARLAEAIAAGGPAAAIQVCSQEAPEIAAAVGVQHGVTIGRTSFKLRNPTNVPPDWALPFMEERTADAQFVQLPEGRTGALLPIKLKAQCVTCHGPLDQVGEDVKSKLAELYPDDQATGFREGDLRGWFWVVVPAEDEGTARPEENGSTATGNFDEQVTRGPGPERGPGRGRGMGRGMGPGRGGMGHGAGMRGDMSTIHTLFAHRKSIRRTVKDLPNGTEAITESDEAQVADLIQEHVPAMERRVVGDDPLPPMTFHPVFVELIKHADEYTFTHEETEKGIKVTYEAEDPFVIMLVREHARLVSRFIENGMAEIHQPYTLPIVNKYDEEPSPAPLAENAPQDLGAGYRLPSVAPAPADNPTSPEKVELGKKLFFDPRLSLTGTVSCNSCHNVMEGGDDGRATSMGIHGRLGPRNAPTVWNSAFQGSQFWDGRAATLEEQAAGPIVAQPEMGMPNHDVVVDRLRAIPGYVAEFADVFPEGQPVTIENAVKAMAAFERTLITPNSPYDRYAAGERPAMTGRQVRGLELFDSVGCTECHAGPNFNNWEPGVADIGLEEFPRSMESSLVTKYSLAQDLGRYEATKQDSDKHYFKTPTLRNITLTAPYFHNGAVPTLSEAVRVMAATQLDTELSGQEVEDLVAFLAALEGEFPPITLPRLPSRPGQSVIRDADGVSPVPTSLTD